MMSGIAFVYATVGSLNLAQIRRSLGDTGSQLAAAGLAMVIGGLLFKLAAVPFHFWIVDHARCGGLPRDLEGAMIYSLHFVDRSAPSR